MTNYLWITDYSMRNISIDKVVTFIFSQALLNCSPLESHPDYTLDIYYTWDWWSQGALDEKLNFSFPKESVNKYYCEHITHLVFSTLSVWYFVDILVNITLSRTTKIARLIWKWEAVSWSVRYQNWLLKLRIEQLICMFSIRHLNRSNQNLNPELLGNAGFK